MVSAKSLSEPGPAESLKVESLRVRIGSGERSFELRADFEVGAGERVSLLGPSGSGKSTLLRAIAGLEESEGKILLGGREISGLAPDRRDIGFVFQDQALFTSLSVLENAAFGLRMRGCSRAEREERVRPWLDRLGLLRLANASVGRLSGGEAQRVAFIRALVWKPRLLLLDEPFSALDPALRGRVRQELLELHQEFSVPLLLVTHDEADVRAIASRTLKLELQEGGKIRRLTGNELILQ